MQVLTHFVLATSEVQNMASLDEHFHNSSLGGRLAARLKNEVVLQGNDAVCHVRCICCSGSAEVMGFKVFTVWLNIFSSVFHDLKGI